MFGTIKQSEDFLPRADLAEFRSLICLRPTAREVFYVNLLKCDPVLFGSLLILRIRNHNRLVVLEPVQKVGGVHEAFFKKKKKKKDDKCRLKIKR